MSFASGRHSRSKHRSPAFKGDLFAAAQNFPRATAGYPKPFFHLLRSLLLEAGYFNCNHAFCRSRRMHISVSNVVFICIWACYACHKAVCVSLPHLSSLFTWHNRSEHQSLGPSSCQAATHGNTNPQATCAHVSPSIQEARLAYEQSRLRTDLRYLRATSLISRARQPERTSSTTDMRAPHATHGIHVLTDSAWSELCCARLSNGRVRGVERARQAPAAFGIA